MRPGLGRAGRHRPAPAPHRVDGVLRSLAASTPRRQLRRPRDRHVQVPEGPAGGRQAHPAPRRIRLTEGQTMADDQPADPSRRRAPSGEAEHRQLPPGRGSRSASRATARCWCATTSSASIPYMRGRMNDAKSYATPQPLERGDAAAARSARSSSRSIRTTQPGDSVVGMGGWQEYAIVDATAARRAAQGRHHAAFRCRPTSARSACRASPRGTA